MPPMYSSEILNRQNECLQGSMFLFMINMNILNYITGNMYGHFLRNMSAGLTFHQHLQTTSSDKPNQVAKKKISSDISHLTLSWGCLLPHSNLQHTYSWIFHGKNWPCVDTLRTIFQESSTKHFDARKILVCVFLLMFHVSCLFWQITVIFCFLGT